jgi:hypothetical protein
MFDDVVSRSSCEGVGVCNQMSNMKRLYEAMLEEEQKQETTETEEGSADE